MESSGTTLPLRNRMRVIKLESWSQLQETITGSEFRSWAFRGQSDADWNLEPTLRRYFINYRIHPEVWSKQEKRVFRIFKRKAHQFLEHLPKDDDAFEWLAIMQHHGAPTRLLDFTWSPYVAAFFALHNATTNAAIWAISTPKLKNSVPLREQLDGKEIGPWKAGNYEQYFVPNQFDFITQGEPYRMNRRLIAQSGTFIIPSRIDKSVTEILEDNNLTDCLVKFELNTEIMRHETLRNLYNMNITNATLFPDLDGLAKSMSLEFELHWAYDPVTGEKYNGFENEK